MNQEMTSIHSTIKGIYLDNNKNLWDLFINIVSCWPKALKTGNYNDEEEFGNKKEVFYQKGNREYDALINKYKLDLEKLTIFPLYSGVQYEEILV